MQSLKVRFLYQNSPQANATYDEKVRAHLLIWIHDHFVELTDTVKLTSNSSSLNKGNHDLDGVRISDLN